MMSTKMFPLTLFLSMLVFTNASSSLRAAAEPEGTQHRRLQYDALFPSDLCKNGPGEDDIGPCDVSRFPICQPNELRCYNRKIHRTKWYSDIQQPMFYIDYDLVLCYPEGLGACSSCSPGRYCVAENRCILDELNYDCPAWL